MFRKTSKLVASAIVGMSLFAGTASADRYDLNNYRTDRQAQVKPAVTLEEQLNDALWNLGYQTTNEHYEDGRRGYTVEVKKEGYRFRMHALFTNDRKYLVLATPVSSELDPAAPNTAAILIKMLESNNQIQPAAFVYNHNDKRVWLAITLRTDLAAPFVISDGIDQLAKAVAATEGTWKLAANDTPPAAATGWRNQRNYRD